MRHPATVTLADLLTVDEAAEALRVSRATLYRLIAREEIEVVKIAGRTLIDRDEVRRLVDESRQPAKVGDP